MRGNLTRRCCCRARKLNAVYAESRQEALKERKKFEQAFRHNPKAVKTVVENWERLTTYYDFPRERWKHLRASNIVESPFSRVTGQAANGGPPDGSYPSSTRPA
jgi:transposase-like protein